MNAIRLLPVMLSMLVLAAHFYRAGLIPLVILTIILLVLLSLKKTWVARLLQIALILGAFEWIRTGVVLIDTRTTLDQPWLRLAIILGAVALFTGSSALLFNVRSLKKRYS